MTAVLVAFLALKTKFEQLAQNTTTVKGIMARTQERARVAEESEKKKATLSPPLIDAILKKAKEVDKCWKDNEKKTRWKVNP